MLVSNVSSDADHSPTTIGQLAGIGVIASTADTASTTAATMLAPATWRPATDLNQTFLSRQPNCVAVRSVPTRPTLCGTTGVSMLSRTNLIDSSSCRALAAPLCAIQQRTRHLRASGAVPRHNCHVQPRSRCQALGEGPPATRATSSTSSSSSSGSSSSGSSSSSSSPSSSTLDALDALFPSSNDPVSSSSSSSSAADASGTGSPPAQPSNLTTTISSSSSSASAQRPGVSRNTAGSSNSSSSSSSSSPGETPVSTLAVGAAVLAAAATLGATVWGDDLADLLYGDGGQWGALDGSGWGPGDALGAALWAVSYWYVTPLQLLLLFLGKTDTERPSDWLLAVMGRAAGLSVEDLDYVAPLWLKAAAAAVCGAGGLATAAAFSGALGDATWAVSSGLGVLVAAGVYELGRPSRLSVEEAQLLEEQWQTFARFADHRLQRSGRCHESEVFTAFRSAHPALRSPEVLPDAALRSMVRNWHPGVERSQRGYLKNLSLLPRVDPFTGRPS